MVTGLVVLVVVLALASAFGVWRKRTDGRVRIQPLAPQATMPTSPSPTSTSPTSGDTTPIRGVESDADSARRPARGEHPVLTSERLGRTLGDRATLLQFSSAFCQPCRATKVILADVASKVAGVEHIEIDAEAHLDLVREIGILRTPTTLVLDGTGRITARASGVPRREQVLAALDVSVR
ncbi:MAG TPA: thioredoxin family protein [Actinocrinis sp.]|nr:thioredoxin family protein [Actinocrinis sp.]